MQKKNQKRNKKKKIFFHEKHPELRPGEIFLTNITLEDSSLRVPVFLGKYMVKEDKNPFDSIGWKTKCKGDIAYDIKGRAIQGMVPVFVKVSELKKAKIKTFNKYSVCEFGK